ncbi:MAG: protein kinase, partial [Planctomycetales bacterium]|nr:protein kinase [Planctomycetales bacterium]
MSENSVTKAFDDSGRQQLLETVMAEYIRACDAGVAPDRQEFLERHPELADDLRDFFSQRDHLNQLAGPMRALGESLVQSVGPGKHISYVGDYELLEEVARGGMGVVYKARQKTLGRIVAVKMMLTGRLANEDDVKRFQIEAQAAANLQHPNIVPIHEVGQHEGLHYFSMDFVEGRSLSAVLRENVLPAKQAASYVRQMAEAIHYAHQQGTLHRDLKPSNVLIDSRDQVRITDFGLAMRVEGDSGLTQTGQIVGTPSYMPPEQAQGKRSLIGPGSDVYSLGAILYECLTGRAPFRADSVMKTIEQVIHREAASPRLLNPGVARDLETICLKCLEKEPHRRYGTAQLLVDDLQSYLDDRPILARPVSTIERTWRWCRRNHAVASLLATVALCLIVGISVSSYFAIEASNRAKSDAFHRGRADDKAKEALHEKGIAELARGDAERRKLEAERNAALAETRRIESDQNAKLARRHLYAAHMNLAQNAWDANLVDQTVRILDLYRPKVDRDVGTDDLRGFEWHYWDRLCHSDLRTLKGHTDGVSSVAFSADGKRLASASNDKTVKVWDTVTGQETLTLKGHTYLVLSVAFSADGKRLASAGAFPDNTVRVWDATTGQQTLTLKGHSSNVTCVAFSGNGMRLASAGGDGTVKVWDVTSGQETLTLKHGHVLTSVAFSADGIRLAAGSIIQLVKVWDAMTGQETLTFRGHNAQVNCVTFSPDGKSLASASNDTTVKVWDTTSGQETLTLKGHSSVAFSPDGNRLASASDGQNVKVWDITSGRELLTLKGHTNRVNSVAFSVDGKRVASASDDKTAKVWDATSGQEPLTLNGHTNQVLSVAFSPDGKRLA